MALFGRNRALVRCHIALYGPDRAGVRMEPAADRWPDRGPPDRLLLGLGMCAWAAHRLPDDREEAFRATLRDAAEAIVAAPPGPVDAGLVVTAGLQGGRLVLLPWAGPGRLSLLIRLERSPAGLVTVLKDPPRAPGALAGAALALLTAVTEEATPEGRLALGLSVEGLLAWYREAHRMTPPRQAVRFAMVHAADRLGQAGRAIPPDLADV